MIDRRLSDRDITEVDVKLWLITVWANISASSRKHSFEIYTLPESALQKQNNRL